MARIANKLTKEMLINYGIYSVEWDEVAKEWVIMRRWHKTNSKKIVEYRLKEQDLKTPHKYGQDKIYRGFIFSYKGRPVTLTVGRLVLAWFHGEIPTGSDACHRDNNELNNALDNLYIDTHANNLKQRAIFYSQTYFNQYKTAKGVKNGK